MLACGGGCWSVAGGTGGIGDGCGWGWWVVVGCSFGDVWAECGAAFVYFVIVACWVEFGEFVFVWCGGVYAAGCCCAGVGIVVWPTGWGDFVLLCECSVG